MSQTLGLTGNLRFMPTDAAPPALIPLSISTTFTQRGGFDVVEDEAVDNVPIPMGSITKPLLLYVEVYAGTFAIATNVDGDNPWTISVDVSPAPTDKALLILYTPATSTQAFYLTTPGPASGRIWVFG